jgi:hypothetical protein
MKKPKRHEIESEVLQYLKKNIGMEKDTEYFMSIITDLIINNAVPIELIKNVPQKASLIGKSRFDQLYDASMSLAFPSYGEETLQKLISGNTEDTKIWRAVYPEKYKLSHVLIRASSYQEAFALACDFGCRVSLRIYKTIPSDMTIRVSFMSEKAVRRYLKIRWANRLNKRRKLQLVGREFTSKEVSGAKLIALGHRDSNYSIIKYSEKIDLSRIKKKHGVIRSSKVEHEAPRKRMRI